MPTTTRRDTIFVLDLGDDDNSFNAHTLGSLRACLDELEETAGPEALVTMASGKIWSTGLDLEYMGTLGSGVGDFVSEVQGVTDDRCAPRQLLRARNREAGSPMTVTRLEITSADVSTSHW